MSDVTKEIPHKPPEETDLLDCFWFIKIALNLIFKKKGVLTSWSRSSSVLSGNEWIEIHSPNPHDRSWQVPNNYGIACNKTIHSPFPSSEAELQNRKSQAMAEKKG